MQDIIVDMVLTQSYTSNFHGVISAKQNDTILQMIYEKYDTDSVAFRNSFAYYSANPVEIDSIFKMSLVKINKLVGEKDTLVPNMVVDASMLPIGDSKIRQLEEYKRLQEMQRQVIK